MSDLLLPDPALLDLIYSAAIGDVDWADPLRRMLALTSMRYGALFNLNEATGQPSMQALVSEDAGSADTFLRQYVSEFHHYDPTPDLVAKWPAGRWFVDSQVLAPQVRQRGVYYNEFLRPLGAANWTGMFVNRGEQSGFLSFVGAPGQPLNLTQQLCIEAVRDHVARALQLRRRLGILEKRSALSLGALDTVDDPLFLLDESASLLLDNAAGRALAAAQPHALHFGGNRFAPLVPGWDLSQWRAACARGALALQTVEGAPLHLLLSPVPPQTQLARYWERPLIMMSAAAVKSHEARARRLRALYNLTPAEAELAVMMACKSMTPQECADARQVTNNTVRTQIKSIQAKLDTQRLPALVAKVLAL